jgi:tetratricopeptide (TPR) repeat protein
MLKKATKKQLKLNECKIISVDLNSSNENNTTITPLQLKNAVLNGLRVDGVVCLEVLGYISDPLSHIALIKASMKKDALAYIINNKISKNKINIYPLLVNQFNQIKLDILKSEKFILKIQNNKKIILPEVLEKNMNKAVKLYEKKEYLQAAKIYDELRKKYFMYSDIYNGLGVNLKVLGKVDDAIKAYIRAIQIDPLNGFIYNNLSNAFKSKQQYQKAIQASYDAIRCDRKNAEFYNNIGLLYEKVKQYENAIGAYKMAIKLNPKYTKAINNLGVLFYEIKEYEKSADIFQIVLNVDPTYYEAYSNMGAALNKAKKYKEAIKALETAIQKNPKHSGAYTNLGNVYNKIYDYKQAVKMHEKSIKLDPKGYNAYSNVGTSYKNLGQMNNAIKSYKKSIELKPDFVNAHFDLATVYLALKDFKNGFKEYESRFQKDEMKGHILKYKNIFSKPRFNGTQDIKDKKLLIHTEQGFGDSIMFAKFVDIIKEKYNCYVILQCRDELRSLFENSFKNIDEFYSRDKDETPEFDYQYSMLSLPYLLGVQSVKDIPKTNPYLAPFEVDELKIKKDKKKIDVGICWSASVTGDSYDGKVFDIEYLRPLIENDKFNVYSLQVGVENEDIKKANLQNKVIDLTSKLTDFNKTAYLMSQLDFVISSDTSVAHLAGAINKEVIVPLQKIPDWRWENKGDKSYWYPSAKLFRQKTQRVWDSVFQSIYAKINKKYKVKIK